MAKFVFELEAVLRQRVALERQRMQALGEAQRAMRALEERLRAMHGRVQEEREELRTQLAGTGGSGTLVDLRGVRFQTNAALSTHAHAQQVVLQLAGAHKRVEQARAALLEATIKRKAVETLRTQRHEAWRLDQARTETLASDDIVGMQALARAATGTSDT